MNWTPAILTSAASAMLALPLAPALRELRRPRDAAPLPIQQHDARIDNFARSFREYIRPLQHLLTEAVAQNVCHSFTFTDGARALLYGTLPDSTPISLAHAHDALLLFGHPVLLQDDICCNRELYAASSLCSGRRNRFRAILAEDDIYLGVASRVLRWAHAGSDLRAASGCVLYGRASAGGAIILAPGCSFERMYAPEIRAGLDVADTGTATTFEPGSTIDRRLGRFRVHGELRLRSGEVLQGNLIARSITLADQCCVIGSLKVSRDVFIESGTRVDGAIVAGTTVRIGNGCSIRGPVLAEGTVSLGRNTRIGSRALPSTVSAREIVLQSGAVVHGTLWARNGGRVEA